MLTACIFSKPSQLSNEYIQILPSIIVSRIIVCHELYSLKTTSIPSLQLTANAPENGERIGSRLGGLVFQGSAESMAFSSYPNDSMDTRGVGRKWRTRMGGRRRREGWKELISSQSHGSMILNWWFELMCYCDCFHVQVVFLRVVPSSYMHYHLFCQWETAAARLGHQCMGVSRKCILFKIVHPQWLT